MILTLFFRLSERRISFDLDLNGAYRTVENAIKLGQAVSILEIIHPMIGFTKGDWLSPFIQVHQEVVSHLTSTFLLVFGKKFHLVFGD